MALTRDLPIDRSEPAPFGPTNEPMSTQVEGESLSFPDQHAWQVWLEMHHATSPGVWLKLARPNVSPKTVTHPEALDICLRYGWIDGQSRSLDETHWLRKFSPGRVAAFGRNAIAPG